MAVQLYQAGLDSMAPAPDNSTQSAPASTPPTAVGTLPQERQSFANTNPQATGLQASDPAAAQQAQAAAPQQTGAQGGPQQAPGVAAATIPLAPTAITQGAAQLGGQPLCSAQPIQGAGLSCDASTWH